VNRRRFIKTGLIWSPVVFNAGALGAVRLAAIETEVNSWMSGVAFRSGHYSALSIVASDIAMKILRPIRPQIKRLNFFLGSDFKAAQFPLIIDAGYPNSDAPFLGAGGAGSGSDFTYNETGVNGGLKPLTANTWLNTGLVPLTDLSQNSMGVSAYVREANGANTTAIGCNTFGGPIQITFAPDQASGNFVAIAGDGNFIINVPDAVKKGFYTLSRTSVTSLVLYRDATSISSIANPGVGLPATNVAVFNNNFNTGPGTSYYAKSLGSYAIHLGLTAAQVVILNNANFAVQTACSRNV